MHLLYINDLKVYAKNNDELERCEKLIKQFIDDIDMSFGLDKCAVLTIKRGKVH